jgi:PadR family transcriptional regulator, regulatory protein PadR
MNSSSGHPPPSTTFDSQTLGRRANELVLLALLGSEPMHGYQVAAEAERRSGGYFAFNHGTLYPILHRLEKEGLIAGTWSDPDAGRPRKEYALTPRGRRYLEEGTEAWKLLQRQLSGILGSAIDRPTSEGGNHGAIRGAVRGGAA